MTRIMIADDASFMREVIKKGLQGEGYTEIIEAKDGLEAISMYRDMRPDLVLLDITMPKADGLQALQEIQKIDPESKVIMCSSHGEENTIIKAMRMGAKDFIVKPFQQDRLVQAINNVLLF